MKLIFKLIAKFKIQLQSQKQIVEKLSRFPILIFIFIDFNKKKMIKKIQGYKIFLKDKLGQGSYGTVYLGEEESTGKKVAIKVIPKAGMSSDPYQKEALFSQIKVMKIVKSENVVNLVDVMESSNNYYIIEQLCDTDFEHYLKKNGQIPQKDAVRFLTQICNGFLSLIREGILHRDLKPANLFMSQNIIKIGDFGFAKKNTTGLKNHSCVGTPLYSSVEVLKGQPYTSKCDIWSLGFIFYQILHNKTPWTAKSQYELIHNIQNKPLKMNENLSKNTKNFLQRALGVKQSQRISWQQIFCHPLFEGFFDKQTKGSEQLENKYKKVMRDIRYQVINQNINLKKLWDAMGFDQKKQLNEKQFRSFIKCIIPKLQISEQNYFFSKMDTNKDGTVSLKQFEIELQKNNIPIVPVFQDRVPMLLNKMISIEEDDPNNQNNHIDTQLEKKVMSCFKKLQNTLNTKKLTLYNVFVMYDKDRSGSFSIKQFGTVMKRLDSSFSDNQIQLIFTLIDKDKSKTVQFSQLNCYYSKIVGIPQSLNISADYMFLKK